MGINRGFTTERLVIHMKKYNVGLIGGGFMGKAHSVAYAGMPMFFWPAPGIPIRHTFCDVTEGLAKDGAARYGFKHYTTDYREIMKNPEIDIVDISTPNNTHAEIAIAAARAGKHILCEKPIATSTGDARRMVEEVKKTGVVNQLAFNYRRIPAVVLAKKFIQEGKIGQIISYRGTYLSGGDTTTPMGWRQRKDIAGYGVLGDVGTHSLDLARYLCGEVNEVHGVLKTVTPKRPLIPGSSELHDVENDDEASFSMKFANGAYGAIFASNNCWGRNNYISFELYGTLGAITFRYDRRDELEVCFSDDFADRRGFKTIQTGGPDHPYGEGLWPIDGIGIGFGELKIIECYDFVKAIAGGYQATPDFNEGYKLCLICDAIAESSKTGAWVNPWKKI